MSDLETPKLGDTATLKLGDFLHEAECVKDPVSGDVCWKVNTGALIDWRKAVHHKGKVTKVEKAPKPETPKDAK